MTTPRPVRTTQSRSQTGFTSAAPAPPGAPPSPEFVSESWGLDVEKTVEPAARTRAGARPFAAELDVAELDDRMRPGPHWPARAKDLSRSHISFFSRRMVHGGRVMLVAIHLIDDEPVPLLGRVGECVYEGAAMHRVTLDLLPVPDNDTVRAWLSQCRTRIVRS